MRLVISVGARNVVRSLTGVTYHYVNYKDFIILLGAVWARTDEASRGDVGGPRSPRAIACALRHAIGF